MPAVKWYMPFITRGAVGPTPLPLGRTSALDWAGRVPLTVPDPFAQRSGAADTGSAAASRSWRNRNRQDCQPE